MSFFYLVLSSMSFIKLKVDSQSNEKIKLFHTISFHYSSNWADIISEIKPPPIAFHKNIILEHTHMNIVWNNKLKLKLN